MRKHNIVKSDFHRLMRKHGDPLAVAAEMQRLHYGKKPSGPTQAQTLEDKLGELEKLGFHGLTLNILKETASDVYNQMVKDGRKEKLARREIGKRIRSIGDDTNWNRHVSDEINAALGEVPQSKWVMQLDLGNLTPEENIISDACSFLDEIEKCLTMSAAEYAEEMMILDGTHPSYYE
jgi:hypothetical protein